MASDTSLTYGVAVRLLPIWQRSMNVATNEVQVVGYLAAGLCFTSIAVNSFVYETHASEQAAAAGFILQSMVIVCSHHIC